MGKKGGPFEYADKGEQFGGKEGNKLPKKIQTNTGTSESTPKEILFLPWSAQFS